MKKAVLFIGALVLGLTAGAQKDANPKKRAHFQSYNALGVIAGESTSAALVQSVNGARFPKWFIGAGVGIDAYKLRSIPLFIDLRAFPFRNRSFFIYGDGGIHLPWVKKTDPTINALPSYSKGLYYDGGFGYQFPIGLRNALLLSAGYTEKQHTEETRSVNPCLMGPCPEYTNRYDYKLRRLSFKLGVMF